MKKSFRTLLAAATVAGLASCATDEPAAPVSGDTDSFSISIPAEVTSRVFSDGSSVKNIYVAVYPADNAKASPYISNFVSALSNKELISGEATVTNGKADLSIQLVKGLAYNVFFWAESYTDNAADCPYTFNPTLRSIKVNYGKMGCNTDAPDAFYYYGKVIADGTNHEITLRRPFAQVNLGTDDYDAAKMSGMEVTETAITFSSLANTFEFGKGTVSGVESDVTLSSTAIPTETQSFPIGDANHSYRYLNMAYVLVNSPADGNAVIDNVSLSINGQTEAYSSYPNIPVRANYRTNIYGSLLTDQTTYKVELSEYEDPDINNPVESEPTFTEVSSWSQFEKAVKRGENVRLTDYIEEDTFGGSINYEFNNSIIVDLGGYSLVGNFTNAKNNTLTIQGNGTMSSTSTLIVNNGNLNVKGGTLQALCLIDNKNGATCTIDGGSFDSTNSRDVKPISNAGIMVINGGTFKNRFSIINNQANADLTIEGGTFISTNNPLDISANTEVTITGGNFIGNHAINLSGGTVNISGKGRFYSRTQDNATICNSDKKSTANITGGYFTNLNQEDFRGSQTWNIPTGYTGQRLRPALTETIEGTSCTFNYQVVSNK